MLLNCDGPKLKKLLHMLGQLFHTLLACLPCVPAVSLYQFLGLEADSFALPWNESWQLACELQAELRRGAKRQKT